MSTDETPAAHPDNLRGPAAPRSSDTSYLVSRWAFLPPHIREAIVTLVDAGLLSYESRQQQSRTEEEF